MKTLYILGNGFDLHHGLDTYYQSFARFLCQFDDEDEESLYENLTKYFDLPDIINTDLSKEDQDKWSNFEIALATLKYKKILSDNKNLLANHNSPYFKDSDWGNFAAKMEHVAEMLINRLINEFNDFILEVDYNIVSKDKLIHLENDSHFLSFNYTETLQNLYGIDNRKIKYIHNKADRNDCNIILGHGSNPAELNEKEEKPPVELNNEQREIWYENKANEYHLSYEWAKQEILKYFTRSFKNTSIIIENHRKFFSDRDDIERIYILGHSISIIDIEYFKEIKNNVSNNVEWHVSYYDPGDDIVFKNKLTGLGISANNVIPIKISDLKSQKLNGIL